MLYNRESRNDFRLAGKKFLINTGDVKEENRPFILVQNWPAEIKK